MLNLILHAIRAYFQRRKELSKVRKQVTSEYRDATEDPRIPETWERWDNWEEE